MKYRIKNIDYTHCHPIIAEHLKRGEAIWCSIFSFRQGEPPEKRLVCHYDANRQAYMYEFGNVFLWAQYAEPIPLPERRLRKASEIIAECERRGWEHNINRDGEVWFGFISAFMLQDCGKTESSFTWPDWAWCEDE